MSQPILPRDHDYLLLLLTTQSTAHSPRPPSGSYREGRRLRHGHGVLLHAGAVPSLHRRAGRDGEHKERDAADHRSFLAPGLPRGGDAIRGSGGG